jgi:hypothetical protein
MSARLRKIDDGHYLVPDSPFEVVREGSGPWRVYVGNDPLADSYYSYDEARRAALQLRDASTKETR